MVKSLLLLVLVCFNSFSSNEPCIKQECQVEKIVSYLVKNHIVQDRCTLIPDTIKVNFSNYGDTAVDKYFYFDGKLDKTDVDFECIRYKEGFRRKCLFIQLGTRIDSNDVKFAYFCGGATSGTLKLGKGKEILSHRHTEMMY